MKKLITLTCVFCMLGQSVECQITNPIFQHNERDPYNVPTPNQSSLGTFGVIPVSPYTGKADISIPIYQTSQRDVVLDINLAYDSSGLLINQLPGWTGHNWTLNAGGAITRKVNGRPDEINYKGTNMGTDMFYKRYQNDVSTITHGIYDNLSDMLYDRDLCYWQWVNDGMYGELYDPYELYYNSKVQDMANNERLQQNQYTSYKNYFSQPSINVNRIDVISDIAGYDTAADIFYFNFFGMSGCFFYGNDGSWKVRSEQNIYVQFDVSDSSNYFAPVEKNFLAVDLSQPKTIKGFTLIDENGNRYIFGGEENCIEYSMSLTGYIPENTTEPWTAISWMLKEVKDRFGNILYEFNYARGQKIVQLQNAYSSINCRSQDSNEVGYNFPKTYSGSINSPVYLDSISVCDGTHITFCHSRIFTQPKEALHTLYPNFGWDDIMAMLNATYPLLTYQDVDPVCPQYYEYAGTYRLLIYSDASIFISNVLDSMDIEQLDSIRIEYPEMNNIIAEPNTYTFDYDFDARMHLTSLSLGDPSDVHAYQFEYKTLDLIPEDYLTKKFDFFGYYNGTEYAINDLYNSCMPDSLYSKMGILTKMIYPTGGYSIFEYEQNTYSKYLSEDRQSVINAQQDKLAGGLRIAGISNYDKDGTPLYSKHYKYVDFSDNLSSGQLLGSNKTHFEWTDENAFQYKFDIISAMSPMSNTYSPNIGYSCVTEINGDGTYTVYSFSNTITEKDNPYISSRPATLVTPFDEFSSRQYRCGLLLSQTTFDSGNDSISHTTYTYNSDEEFNDTSFVATTSFTMHPVFGNMGSRYKLYYFKPEVTSKISKTKFGGKWVTDETVYDRQHFNIVMQDSAGHEHSSDVWKTLSESTTRGSSTVKSEFSYPFLEFDEDVITHNVNDTIFLPPILPRLDDPDSPLPRVNPDAPAHPIDETLFPNPLRDRMIANKQLSMQFCFQPIRNRNYLNNSLIDGQETAYRMVGEMPVPDYVISYASDTTECDTVCKYISYDSRFRPLCIVDRNNVCKTLYWNDRNQLIGIIANGSADDCTEVGMDVVLNSANSALFSSAPIATNLYEYDHHGKVVRTLSNNRIITQFEYDLFGRLTKSKNQFGETTKRYYYNYGMTGNTNASSH